MKVLQLISSSGQYGAENMLLDLATSAAKYGCTSIVAVFQNSHRLNTEILESAQKRGLTAIGIPCWGQIDRRAVRRILDYIREHGIELIHSHGYKSNLYGYWAARAVGVPTVATCHGWPGKSLRLRLYYSVDRFVLRRFDHVAVVSDVMVRTLRLAGVSPLRISQIPNGIDVGRFSRIKEELEHGERRLGVRIGVVGRLAPEKGLSIFLKAARAVLSEYPETEFVLFGEGPERSNIESLSRTLEIRDKITLAGVRRDMPAAYRSFDIFVLPSLSEGMPLVLLEAMAAGKPVIASRVGAIPSLISPGKNGLLAEPGDVRSLEDAMLRYLREPIFANKMGINAMEHARKYFCADTMASRYVETYQKVLHEEHTFPAVSVQEA
jgi:glycosyltransferase involved in cell wall biosynthesis